MNKDGCIIRAGGSFCSEYGKTILVFSLFVYQTGLEGWEMGSMDGKYIKDVGM